MMAVEDSREYIDSEINNTAETPGRPRRIGNSLLFPESMSLPTGTLHLQILSELLQRKGELTSQKELIKATGANDSSFSRAKLQLIAIGWVIEQQVAQGRALRIAPKHINDVKAFVSGWSSLGRSAMVRPHSLVLTLSIQKVGWNAVALMKRLSREYWVVPSAMKNNGTYTTHTPYGLIVFKEVGRYIHLYLTGVVLPVLVEDVPFFEQYLTDAVAARTAALMDILVPALEDCRFLFSKLVVLKQMHLGLITPKTVPYVLSVAHQMRDVGVYVDDSIAHCDEIEVEGTLQRVAAVMSTVLEAYFKELDARRGVPPVEFKTGTEVL